MFSKVCFLWWAACDYGARAVRHLGRAMERSTRAATDPTRAVMAHTRATTGSTRAVLSPTRACSVLITQQISRHNSVHLNTFTIIRTRGIFKSNEASF